MTLDQFIVYFHALSTTQRNELLRKLFPDKAPHFVGVYMNQIFEKYKEKCLKGK